MFELNGKYNSCKIFTDNVDAATIGQLMALLNQKSVSDSKIRIMPDTHAGAGCVIGTTMTIKDKVIPNLVGVDIGCGMRTVSLGNIRIDLPKLDSKIHNLIPSGFETREKEHYNCKYLELEELKCKNAIHIDRAYKSLGTLGGGNHFIEVDQDDEGNKYLVIHTGSRYLGKQVAEYYQNEAWKRLKDGNRGELIKKKIEELKAAGRQQEIESAITTIKSTVDPVPKELAYCEGDLFDDYIHDMKIVQDYAKWNRITIADTIVAAMNFKIHDDFETIHNYIDTDYMILRKGSVSARNGERLLIPINMRDGSLICVGKGNDDWNQSAPHGAGRLMSRREAKEKITVHEFKKTMDEAGVYSTSVGRSTLDESPMAYKPMEEIMSNIEPTVEIEKIIKPIYNFKAGDEE